MVDTNRDASGFQLIFGLNDRPALWRTVLYGLQWMIIFLPTLTVVSGLTTDILGFSAYEKAAFFQKMLLVVGATMILQTLLGHRLPLLDGPSMALIVTTAAQASSGLPAICGGMILGGFLVFLCGALGLMHHLVKIFTPRVIVVILMLISLSLIPFMMPMLLGVDKAHPHGQPAVMGLTLGLIVLTALLSSRLKGLWQTMSILWGVCIGIAAFAIMGLTDFSAVNSAPWVAWPRFGFGPWPTWEAGPVISFMLGYLAVLVNATGSLFSVDALIHADNLGRRIERGVAFTGLAGLAAGATGVVGTVPYSTSPGIITVTRVGTRFPLTACGVLVILLAFFDKAAAAIISVPTAVVASALCISMAAQVGVCFDVLKAADRPLTGRDYMIIGLPILLGALASIMPPEALKQLPPLIRPLAGNGLVTGVVFVMLLEHVIYRRAKKK